MKGFFDMIITLKALVKKEGAPSFFFFFFGVTKCHGNVQNNIFFSKVKRKGIFQAFIWTNQQAVELRILQIFNSITVHTRTDTVRVCIHFAGSLKTRKGNEDKIIVTRKQKRVL